MHVYLMNAEVHAYLMNGCLMCVLSLIYIITHAAYVVKEWMHAQWVYSSEDSVFWFLRLKYLGNITL